MVSSGATRAKVLRNSRGLMLRRDLDGFPSRPGGRGAEACRHRRIAR